MNGTDKLVSIVGQIDESVDFDTMIKAMKIDDPNFQNEKSKACNIF